MKSMCIGGLQKLTLIDYPGKLAATVFLIGCDFRCPWCYSSELVLPEKIKKQFHPVKSSRGGISSKTKLFNGVNPVKSAKGGAKQFNGAGISEKDFFDFLKERKGLLEGVVICGGEPTINDELPQFIKRIKKLGYLVKLDTNGSNPKMLKDLISKKLIDYVAMDVKAPLGTKSEILNPKSETNPKSQIPKYEKVTGVKVDFTKIKKSIEIVKNSGIDYEFRTAVVPTLHTKEDIIQIAREISPAKRYYLQNFRPEKTIDPKFEKIKPYSREYLAEIQRTVSPFFEICKVR